MSWFPWRKLQKRGEDATYEGLVAKIEANIEYKAALERLTDAEKQSDRLHTINRRNHFVDNLNIAFGGPM